MDVNKAINKQEFGVSGVNRSRDNNGAWNAHNHYTRRDVFHNWGSNNPGWMGSQDFQGRWGAQSLNTAGYAAYYGNSSQTSGGYGGNYYYSDVSEAYGGNYSSTSGGGPIRSSTNIIPVSLRGGYRSTPYGNNIGLIRGRGISESTGGMRSGVRGDGGMSNISGE